MARIARADVGPLAPYADGYRELLAGLGFTPNGVVRKLWELGRLGDWMIRNELGPEDLTSVRFDEFSALCKAGVERPVGYRTLAPLVGYLRGLGAVPSEMFGVTPVDELVDRFRSWMVTERALAERTVGRYEATAHRFLTARAERRGGGCGAEDLAGWEMFEFLLAETARVSVGSAKGRVAELRCLLRFLFLEGFTESSLAVSIPPVAGWRDTILPATLSRSQVEAIVAAHDRSTVTGRRNFAIVLLLARLGLRAAEVGGLQLEDLDWRAGQLVVRGKARRDDPLPLPADVGEAIAAYLRDGRPVTPCRAVFITRFAPLKALAPQSVSKVVYEASRRAGIDPPVCSHRLRHALATDMLAAGVTLPDISQVLRHRDLATTAIYAKVDHDSLRTLAVEWPQLRVVS
ncbi:MAG TPA: tyrosine-type recombinase/integrase [Microthrixaceae bacterium]|nr:tyrosine-type recombinase/integrase [Microthrixaceae bacterium]HMT62848.1 tyrosine-type recombinase/integrase [Microthrixaceae bacterium]